MVFFKSKLNHKSHVVLDMDEQKCPCRHHVGMTPREPILTNYSHQSNLHFDRYFVAEENLKFLTLLLFFIASMDLYVMWPKY